MSTVVSLGSINADFVVRSGESPSGPGSLLATDFLRTSGGKAANVAVLARRLGAPAILLGCVGDDDLAQQALAGPLGAGVDVAGVRRRPGASGYSAVTVPPDGAKTIVLAPNANDGWADAAEEVGREIAAMSAGSVLVADLEVPVAVVRAALVAARRAGLTTVLDPAPPDRLSDDLLDLADHLTPDHAEAARITGADTGDARGAARAAGHLRQRGAATVHVKLADGGCVTAGDVLTLVRAPDVPVVDATGAGDAFAGALGWALGQGHPVARAAEYAVAASACAVGGYGSQESYPDLEELTAMVERVRSCSLPSDEGPVP